MSMSELLALMARLRNPDGGCPWDLQQTFRTIAPYTIEEAYEVVDAIEREDLGALRGELGDLLLQVVFHAQMAKEAGAFDFDDVVAALCDKLVRRHPHVFGDTASGSIEATAQIWEAEKHKERAARGAHSVLDDIPVALPALARADKIGKRAARVGFDWKDPSGARAKVEEELAEIDEALARGDVEDTASEIGDLLFACASYARHLGVDPEAALRGSTQRFERRFRFVESRQQAAHGTVDLETLESWWQQAKRAERGGV